MTQVKVNAPSKVNIQMPQQMLYNNGESVVKKSSGLTRVRKGQSEEEYLSQRNAFWTTGPLVQNYTFVTQYVEDLFEHEIDSTDFSVTEQSKHSRETIMHGLERLYFQRQYEQCLKDIRKIKDNIQLHDPDLDLQAKKNRNIRRILSELDNMSEMCIQKLHLRNQERLSSI